MQGDPAYGSEYAIANGHGKRESAQKVKGFQLGTDDYLTKPFDPLELVMRVKALLKRYLIASSQTIQLGALC